jgi:hypothetical protein
VSVLPPRSLVLACGLAIALSAAPAVADQSDDLARLREEAAQQRRDLEGTEARIHALEEQTGNPAARDASPQPISPLDQLKKSWSQVEPGTSKERVQVLLGPPERVLHIDGTLVWYYAYPGIGPASVFFNARNVVSSRQAPPFGWW